MKRYETVLFDLDGTIIDSGLGITNSVAYSLRKFGIEVEDRNSLFPFVGPPLTESFQKHFGFTLEQADQAVLYYREYYRVWGMHENTIYPGIPELLRYLKESGRKVIVTTSKPELFAKEILKELDLAKYFDLIAGAEMDELSKNHHVRIKKEDVIAYAFEQMGIEDRADVILVGDREHDVIGAARQGVDSIGVLYGYGSREEFEGAGATYIAATPQEAARIIDGCLPEGGMDENKDCLTMRNADEGSKTEDADLTQHGAYEENKPEGDDPAGTAGGEAAAEAGDLCPCCGIGRLKEKYDICEICDWENDPVQNADPDFAGGANELSLNEYRKLYWEKNGIFG